MKIDRFSKYMIFLSKPNMLYAPLTKTYLTYVPL